MGKDSKRIRELEEKLKTTKDRRARAGYRAELDELKKSSGQGAAPAAQGGKGLRDTLAGSGAPMAHARQTAQERDRGTTQAAQGARLPEPVRRGIETSAAAQREQRAGEARRKLASATDRRSRTAYRQELEDAIHPLSPSDRALGTVARREIQAAKRLWERGEALSEQGRSAAGALLKEQAHRMAERERNERGYSGGESGADRSQPELTGEDRYLTKEGQQLLRALKLRYDRAERDGDREGMEAARRAGQELRETPGAWDRARQRERADRDEERYAAAVALLERQERYDRTAGARGRAATEQELAEARQTVTELEERYPELKRGAGPRMGLTLRGAAEGTAGSLAETAGWLMTPAGDGRSYRDRMTGDWADEGPLERAAARMYGRADALLGRSDEDLYAAKFGLGALGDLAVDVGTFGAQMVPELALGAATGGVGGLAAMAGRAFGGGAHTARMEGADYGRQGLYGLGTALTELATEKLFSVAAPFRRAYGGGARIGGRSLDDLLVEAMGRATRNETAAQLIASATTEGLEEIVADAVDPVLRSIYNGQTPVQNYKEEDVTDWLYDGLVGAILGGLGGAAGQAIRRDPLRQAAEAAAAQQRTEAARQEAAAARQETEAARQETEAARQEAAAAQQDAPAKPREADERPVVAPSEATAARRQLERAGAELGTHGRRALTAAYEEGTDTAAYFGGFSVLYEAGRTGQRADGVQSDLVQTLEPEQKMAAYVAGQNDAALARTRERRAAKYARPDGTGPGLVYDSFVEEAIESRRGLRDERGREVPDVNGERRAYLTEAMADRIDGVAKALDVRVQFVDSVRRGTANAQIRGRTVLIEKDNRNPVMFLVGHEMTHRMQALAPDAYRTFRDFVAREEGERVQARMDSYAAEGVELTREKALDELAADYAGRMIDEGRVLDDFLAKHRGERTLLQRVRDAIRAMISKLTGAEKRKAQTAEGKLTAALEAAARQAKDLEANKNAAHTDGEAKFSIKRTSQMTLAEQLKMFYDGKMASSDAFYFGETPAALEKSGFDALPLAMTIGDFRKSTQTKHNIPRRVLKNLMSNLASPLFSFGSGDRAGIILDDIDGDGHKLLAALERGTNMDRKPVNVINSLYGLEHPAEWIKNQIDSGNEFVLYDEKRANAFLQTYGYSASVGDGIRSTGESVTQNGTEVKAKFSLKEDNRGRKLTEAQQDFFQDSKVVDEDGQLKVMYRGGNSDFTVFDRKRSSYANLYGRGFYFTDSEAHARQYGSAREFYLNITHPVSTTETAITRSQMRKFLEAVAANEDDFSFENYGYGATVDSVLRSVYGKSDFAMLYDVDQTAIGDMVAAVELFNEVNGTDYDGLILDTETVAFRSDQIKNTDNQDPTDDPDVRYSLKNVNGKQVVWLEDSSLTNKELNSYKAVAGFIARHIGEFYTIVESGQKVYIGKELPREYTQSKYTSYLHKTDRAGFRAKRKAIDGFGELIETATDRRWEKTKHPKSKDAKYGMYRYDSTFAFPVKDSGGTVQRVRAYDIELLIRNASDGKKYLYDIVNIKENTSAQSDLTKREARSAAYRAATGGSVSMDSIRGREADVNEEFSLKAGTESKSAAELEKENALLRARVEHFKGQLRRGPRTDRKETRRRARELIGRYQATAPVDEVAEGLRALGDRLITEKELSWEEAYRDARAIARGIAESAVEVHDELYQDYEDLRRWLRETRIEISERDRAGIPDYGQWRKRQFGRLRLAGGRTNVDRVYQELGHRWPEFFPQGEDGPLTPEDQLLHIAWVADDIYTVVEGNPYRGHMEQIVSEIASDVMATVIEMPQAKKTFADREQAKLDRAVAEGRRRTRQAVEAEREARKREVKRVMDKYWDKRHEDVEARTAVELRGRIVRHASKLSQRLLKPTDKQHIPERMRFAVAGVLNCINMTSMYVIDPDTGKRRKDAEGDPVRMTEKWLELKNAYETISLERTGAADNWVIDPDLMENLTELGSLSNVPIAQMKRRDLVTVWNTLRAVERNLFDQDRALSRARYETISEVAEQLRRDNQGKREVRLFRGPMGVMGTYMLTPQAFFHRLGPAGEKIFRTLRDAQDRYIVLLDRAAADTKRMLEKADVKGWEKESRTFRLASGETVTLTTAQRMSLYELLKRPQARKHILNGGIRPKDRGEGLRDTTRPEPIHLSIDDCITLTSDLTAEQRRAADALQRYMAKELAAEGNRASMEAYGYEKFKETHYFPIPVDRNQVARDEAKEAKAKTVPGRGFTKGTVPEAKNAVMLDSVFSVYAEHVNEMLTYAAWLGPMEDLRRIANYTFRDGEGERTGTVRALLERVFGRTGTTYLDRLMGDLNQGVSATETGNPFERLTANYKAASVSANLRVVLQQPSAIFRAMDQVRPTDFALGLARAHRGTWAKVKRWAPIARWKDWGYFDIHTGRQVRNVLLDDDSVLERVRSAMMAPAGAMDSLAWSGLWNALEVETRRERPELTPGSDAFHEAVAERFCEVVDRTQVVDGILQRSQFMRFPDIGSKMATAFMGEPTKTYDQFVNAVYDLKQAQEPKARREAMGRLGRTCFALTASVVVNAAFGRALMDAIRDDDDDETYAEKYRQALTGLEGDEEGAWEELTAVLSGDLASDFQPWNYIPYIKEISSLLAGYKAKRMDLDSITQVILSFGNAIKAIRGESKLSVGNAVTIFMADAAKLLGVPVGNLKRDIEAIYRTWANGVGDLDGLYGLDRLLYGMNERNTGRFLDMALKAKERGDTELLDRIEADMREAIPGMSAEDFDEKMEARAKRRVQETEGFAAAQERILGPLEDRLEGSAPYQALSEELKTYVQETLASYAKGMATYEASGGEIVPGDAVQKLMGVGYAGIDVADYVTLRALVKDLTSVQDPRTGKTIEKSKSILIRKAVEESGIVLPEDKKEDVLELLGVSREVRSLDTERFLEKTVPALERRAQGLDEDTRPDERTASERDAGGDDGTYHWSFPGARVSSAYGMRTHPIFGDRRKHDGIDIPAPAGTAIGAARSGTVVFVGQSSARGKYVDVQHDDGMVTRYQHCSEILVSRGDTVGQDQTIAKVGSTGDSTGPHLHLELLKDGRTVDPQEYLG